MRYGFAVSCEYAIWGYILGEGGESDAWNHIAPVGVTVLSFSPMSLALFCVTFFKEEAGDGCFMRCHFYASEPNSSRPPGVPRHRAAEMSKEKRAWDVVRATLFSFLLIKISLGDRGDGGVAS